MKGKPWRGPLICGHPGRKHCAREMCASCYQLWWRNKQPNIATWLERPRHHPYVWQGPLICGHPNRTNTSHGKCRSCSNAAWRTENPEIVKTYRTKYNNTHREEIRAYTVTYNKTHREQIRMKSALQRKRHPGQQRAIRQKKLQWQVYKHLMANGFVLYTGKTNFLDGRTSNHKSRSPWMDETKRIQSFHCEDEVTACIIEMMLIRRHEPPYNKAGMGRYKQRVPA